MRVGVDGETRRTIVVSKIHWVVQSQSNSEKNIFSMKGADKKCVHKKYASMKIRAQEDVTFDIKHYLVSERNKVYSQNCVKKLYNNTTMTSRVFYINIMRVTKNYRTKTCSAGIEYTIFGLYYLVLYWCNDMFVLREYNNLKERFNKCIPFTNIKS